MPFDVQIPMVWVVASEHESKEIGERRIDMVVTVLRSRSNKVKKGALPCDSRSIGRVRPGKSKLPTTELHSNR
jgi:hypothetical protein